MDEHQQTNVNGLYAAGDVVSELHQISVGTAHAAIPATHIHNTLPPNPRSCSSADVNEGASKVGRGLATSAGGAATDATSLGIRFPYLERMILHCLLESDACKSI